MAIEAKTRCQTRCKELDDIEKEQVKLLLKYRNLAQFVIPGSMEADTDNPLEKAYQLFESVVSTLQAHMQNTKEEQQEETSRLLMQQYTAFSEAYKVLQDHMEESVITEGVLWDWPTYYGQVFQQTRQTREQNQTLEKRKSTEEALRNTIQDQIVLEIAKLQRLESQAHQWVHQALPSLEKLDTIYL